MTFSEFLNQGHFNGDELATTEAAMVGAAIVGIDTFWGGWLKGGTIARLAPLTTPPDLTPLVKTSISRCNKHLFYSAANGWHFAGQPDRLLFKQVKESHFYAPFLGGFQIEYTTEWAKS